MALMFALFALIPGNAIYRAPKKNKAIGFGLLIAAAVWLVAWGKDLITLVNIEWLNNLVTVGIGAVVAIIALCVLAVWHK